MTWRGRRTTAMLCSAVLGLALSLSGCGGGTTGDAAAGPLTPTLPELSGSVTDGAAVPDLTLQVTVKGNVGTARTAEGRRDALNGNYLASLDQLSGPYLLRATSAEAEHTMSVATAPGTANVTPLTTLVTAQLLAREPFAYFDGLGGRGGFTAATPEAIAAATASVRRTLVRDFGFELPASLGDWITAPFQPVAGDAMFDSLAALRAALAAAGTDYHALATTIAEEAGRCQAEHVNVASGSEIDPFCPFSKRNEVDPEDSSVYEIGFGNVRGDALAVRVRGDAVLSAELLTAGGDRHACSAAACRGISLGTAAADLTQPLSFSGAVLLGGGASVVLDGTLQTSVPGIALPGLPCSANRYYLIHPDRSVEGYCALPDDYGLGVAGRSATSGSTRIVYTFDGEVEGVAGPAIEVVTQGDAVLRVLAYRRDPETGLPTPLYQCRDGGCTGATLGPVRIDGSLGIPIELRDVHLDDVPLQAVLPDGSLSGTDPVTLQAELAGYIVNDPSALPLLPVPCTAGAPSVAATLSDVSEPVNVCVPDDAMGFLLSGTYFDAGTRTHFVQGLLSDEAGSFTPGNAVNVFVRGGAVIRVSFDAFGGPSYGCEGSACAGVSVSAPNGAGERTVSFAGTLLQEIATAGLPADRTASLSGSFVAPPP